MSLMSGGAVRFPEEVFERVLDRGMVLDGLSHLVALASNSKITARSSTVSTTIPTSRGIRPRDFAPVTNQVPAHFSEAVHRATVLRPRAPSSLVRVTRIINGELYADILPDRKHLGRVWLYVVQRSSSPDVLGMGSAGSESRAEADALEAISDLRQSAAAFLAAG